MNESMDKVALSLPYLFSGCVVALCFLLCLSCVFSKDEFALPPFTSISVILLAILLAFTRKKEDRNKALLKMVYREQDKIKQGNEKNYKRHMPLQEADTRCVRNIFTSLRHQEEVEQDGYEADNSALNSPERIH
jgi:hypothetical protein